MAAKSRSPRDAETVEIDGEAYRRLEDARGAGESFSAVIKRYVRPRQTADDILQSMRRAAISSATLQAIEESATRRRRTRRQAKD
jgi:predicted CopG family antitoxin